MSKIKIDSDSLRNKIELLKVEKTKIDDVLENFKGESLKIGDYWSGKSGDNAKEQLDSYTDEFDYISNYLQKFISYLEYVAKTYEDEDKLISNKIDSNGSKLII